MGFATLESVKLILEIDPSDTSQDANLQLIVDAVNGEMLDLFGLTDADPSPYTEILDIIERDDGQDWVKVNAYPITSLSTVQDVGGKVYSNAYHRPIGRVNLKCGCFRYGRQTTEVSYMAGFEPSSPARKALNNAANMAVIAQYNTAPKTGFIEEQIGKYRVKLASVSGGGGGGGLISEDGLPMAWGRIVSRHVRAFAHLS